MAYEFGNLSPADFEDLVRDLVGREFGVRFEAFAPGPDGGMDGRHAKGGAKVILQAKHYAGSTYAGLKSEIKRERSSIDRLRANPLCARNVATAYPAPEERARGSYRPFSAI